MRERMRQRETDTQTDTETEIEETQRDTEEQGSGGWRGQRENIYGGQPERQGCGGHHLGEEDCAPASLTGLTPFLSCSHGRFVPPVFTGAQRDPKSPHTSRKESTVLCVDIYSCLHTPQLSSPERSIN